MLNLSLNNINITPEGVILFITFLVNLSLALFIYFRNSKRKINIVFGLIIFLVACWNITNFFAHFFNTYDQALFWTQVALASVLFIPSLMLYFSYIFPKDKKLEKWKLFLIFIPGFLALPFIFTEYNVLYLKTEPWGSNFVPGPLYLYYTIYFIIYVGKGLINLFLEYKKQASSIIKQQVIYIFFGILLAGAAGVTTNAVLPLLGTAKYNVYGTPFSIALGLCVAYAITRYRFMDIKVVIRKSLIYFFTLTILISLVILFTISLQYVLREYFNINPNITIIVVMILIIFSIPALRDYIQKKFDLIFKRDYIDLSKKFDELENLGFTPRYKISKFTRDVAKEIKRRLKLSKIEFLVLDYHGGIYKDYYPGEGKLACKVNDKWITAIQNSEGDVFLREELEQSVEKKKNLNSLIKALRKQKIEVAIPLKVDEDLLGVIMCGKKENDNSFSKEEIEYMQYAQGRSKMILSRLIMYEEALKQAMRRREEENNY